MGGVLGQRGDGGGGTEGEGIPDHRKLTLESGYGPVFPRNNY